MANNKDVLLSFGVDEKSLKSAVKEIVAGLRTGIETELQKKPLKLPSIDISSVKVKGALDLSTIRTKGFIEIPVDKIQWTGGSLDLSQIPIKGAVAANGSTASTGTATQPTGTTTEPAKREQIIINQQEINATTAALERLKQSLTAVGAKEKEASQQTQELTRHLQQVQRGYENIQIARNARVSAGGSSQYTEAETQKIFQLQQRLFNVNKELETYNKELAVSNIHTKRSTDFMESFGFKVGILGFSLGILGGHLQRLTQNLVQFVTASAKAAEPLERIRNLITQLVDAGDIKADQKDSIFNEINRLSDLPGSSLNAVTEGFRKLLVVTRNVGQSLKLVEQLTKATGRSGTGERGLGQLIFQLAQFAESGQLIERDIKTIKEQGGADISQIVSKLGGKEGIQQIGAKKFFEELITGLQTVDTPLDAAQDKLNRINNSLVRMRLNVLEIIKPGLDDLLKGLHSVEQIVQAIKDKFDTLSPSTRSAIGSSILGVVALTGALSALLTVLAAVGIALAGGNHLLAAFGVTTKTLLPSIRGLVTEWNSWTKLKVIMAPATDSVRGFAGAVTSLPGKIRGSISAVIGYFKELAFFAQLKGIGTFGGAKGNAIVEFVKLLGTGLRTGGGLLGTISSLTTAVSGLGAGLLRILGFTTPLGIIINIIVALITNFGNFRTKVVKGLDDIWQSFKRLYDTFTKFSETKAGTFILAALHLILDVIEGIFAVVGSGIQFILDLISNVIDFVSDFLDLFNSSSFPDFLNKLGTLIIRTITNILKSVGKLVLNLFGDLINLSANFLVKLKLVSPEQVEEFNVKLQEAKENLDDLNVSVKDGKVVINRYSDALKEQKTELDQCVVDLEEVRLAYEKVTAEAEKAHKELDKKISDNAITAFDNQISEIQAHMSQLAADYKDNLGKMSDRGNINKATDELNAALKADRDKINAAWQARFNIQIEAAKKELGENPLIKGALGTGLGPHIKSVLESQGIDKIKVQIDNFRKLAEAAGSVDSATVAVWKQMSAAFKFLVEGDAKKMGDIARAAQDVTRSIQKAYDDRLKQLGLENSIREKEKALSAEDTKIKEAQEKIEAIKAEREQRYLTSTVARAQIVAQEKIIAESQYNKDLAKLIAERDKLNSDDRDGQADYDQKELNLKTEHQANLRKIDEKATADAAKDSEKATADRLARLQNSQATLLKVIEPFQEQLFKLLARTQTDGLEKTASGINAIGQALETIGGEIPGMKDFVQSLRDLTSGKDVDLTKVLTNLVRLPAKTELNNNIREAVRSLKPIIMDELLSPNEDFKNPITLVYGDSIPPAIAAILGVKPNGQLTVTSRKQLSDAIDNASIDINDMIKAAASVQDKFALGKIPLEDFEEFMAQFSKVLEANTKVQDINLNQANAILMAMDTALANVQNVRLDTLLSEIQAKIQIFEEKNKETGLSKNLEKIRKLRIQEQIYLYQKEDLAKQFSILEKIRETKDAEEKKQLFITLQNERVRIFKEAQQKIIEAAGGIKPKDMPKLTPVNLPGADGSQPEETKPGNQGGEEDTLVNRINRIKQAFDDAGKSGREARDAIMGLFDAMASGESVVDAFGKVIEGSGSMLEVFGNLALSAFAAFGKALSSAIVDTLVNGEDFLASLGKFFGELLIMIGEQLIQLSIALPITAFITELMFWMNKGFGFLFALPMAASAAAATLPIAAAGTAIGIGLIAIGAALGGGGSKSGAKQASSVNASNTANASTGATGNDFDPNKDPKTIYQKQLAANIIIDIRTDDTQIVKTIVKHVNGNGRLATLIGNRKLQFGY